MRFKPLHLVVALLASMPHFVPLADSVGQVTSPLYSDLSQAYGFYNGQRFTIERIRKEFPTLAAEALKAQMEFDLVFGSSYENIENELRKLLGDKWNEYKNQMRKQLASNLGNSSMSDAQAVAFVKQVTARAKGQAESPVLETLLTYNPTFQKTPAEEFLRGFTQIYRTKNHPKAKGIDFQIQYPKSWQVREGQRPNVIQFITSENGRGPDSIILMVKDIPLPEGYKGSDEEINDFFTPESLREILPEGSSFISAKPVVLDGRKGGMLVFDLRVRLGGS